MIALAIAGGEAQVGAEDRAHFGGAQVAGHENQRAREIHAAVVAEGQSGLVEDSQEQIPQGIAGLFDLVEQDEAQLNLVGVVLVEHFLAKQGMGFAMPEVSGRRTDQLGDFVAMLKLRAIDLDDRAGIAHQAFRGGFHQARFAGTGGSQEEQIADRPSGAGHAGQVRLINADDLLNGLVLADDSLPQIDVQLLRLKSGLRWIELFVQAPHCRSPFTLQT